MKKIRIILTILFLFMPFSVFAEVKCKDVVETYSLYTTFENEINTVGCNDEDKVVTLSQNDVNKCNDLLLKSSFELSKLFKYKDNYDRCFSDEMNNLVESKENNCSPLFNDSIKSVVSYLLKLLFIIGPILVIVFGSLDFTKAVVASDAKSMKKAQTNFIKRLAALILLILTPEIVNILLNSTDVFEESSGLSGYSCDFKYITYTNKYKIETKRVSEDTSLVSNTTGRVIFKQSDPRWGNQHLFCSNDTIAHSGCALASVSMQIKNAGINTIISDFNPGTFSSAIIQNKSAECNNNGDNMVWDSYVNYITFGRFGVYNIINISGNYSQKVNTLEGYINQGYYPVIQVQNADSHFVAVFYVSNGQLYVGDPADVSDNRIGPLKSTYNLVSQSFPSKVILYEKK